MRNNGIRVWIPFAISSTLYKTVRVIQATHIYQYICTVILSFSPGLFSGQKSYIFSFLHIKVIAWITTGFSENL